MEKKVFKIYEVKEAIKVYGGYVKWYHSTERLDKLVQLTAQRTYKNMLACCGGGDAALTLSSMLKPEGKAYIFDINPAQLFVLAAKAVFLAKQKKPPFYPDFKELKNIYPDTIFEQPQDYRFINKLYNIKEKNYKRFSHGFSRELVFLCDDGIFIEPNGEPFWKDNLYFVKRVKSRVGNLRLMHTDFFYADDLFAAKFFDLIYISDMCLNSAANFYLKRLTGILKLLAPGGLIIGNLDSGDRHLNTGKCLIEILKEYSRHFNLEVKDNNGSLWALRKVK